MFQLALRIKESRTAAKLSQAALARQLGLDRSAVAQWERDNAVGPTVGNLSRIALATGVSFEWLVTGRGARFVGGDGQDPPGIVMDYIAQSESEERLLVAFRSLPALDQVPVLAMVEKAAKAS
jgi:transcriptional regulator with XRE-family HTH domain